MSITRFVRACGHRLRLITSARPVRLRVRSLSSSLLELSGLSAIVYGVHTVSAPAGWIVGGLSAVLLSLALDRKHA